jgi:hypothetical protein
MIKTLQLLIINIKNIIMYFIWTYFTVWQKSPGSGSCIWWRSNLGLGYEWGWGYILPVQRPLFLVAEKETDTEPIQQKPNGMGIWQRECAMDTELWRGEKTFYGHLRGLIAALHLIEVLFKHRSPVWKYFHKSLSVSGNIEKRTLYA